MRKKQPSLWLDPGMVEDEEEISQAEGSKGPSGTTGGQAGMRVGGSGGREMRCESRDSTA